MGAAMEGRHVGEEEEKVIRPKIIRNLRNERREEAEEGVYGK